MSQPNQMTTTYLSHYPTMDIDISIENLCNAYEIDDAYEIDMILSSIIHHFLRRGQHYLIFLPNRQII